ncbi:MAG TPA: adenine deaminase C-terminal domain-containing protein [Desulfitobacteriaceae bacterium]|nr:adenine deaminase C-terminal domain-containing protein [Desulfitobacteriaceae bacterium]
MLSATELKCLVEVAQGKREADLYVEGGNLINVYSGEIYPANIAVSQGRVAYLGNSRSMVGPATRLIKAEGYYLSPGYIESHSHPWLIYNPVSFASAVLPLGTTTLVCDNLALFLQGGEEGFTRLINWMADLAVDFYWSARLLSQSAFERESGLFTEEVLKRLFAHPRVLTVAEITRWPLLAEGNEALLQLVTDARESGLRIDGHTAGCSAERLNALAPVIDSCHEAISAEDVMWRLRLGLWVMLRHSSLRQDLPELLRAVTVKGLDSGRMILTTDGSTAGFTDDFGFLDGMLNMAVESGMDPVQALKMVTLNPATYLGLDKEKGGLAPGRQADILLLPDLKKFRPDLVLVRGQVVSEGGCLSSRFPVPSWTEFGLKPVGIKEDEVSDPDLYGIPSEIPMEFPVIDLISTVITKEERRTLSSRDGFLEKDPDLLYCALLDNGGQWRSLGFVKGLGSMEALATTYNTSCQLLVLGKNRSTMAKAAARVVVMGGGICLLRNGSPVFELSLEIGGIMNGQSFGEAAGAVKRLAAEAKSDGYSYDEFLYTLFFLVCDFLPGLRLTPKGLLEIKTGKILFPALQRQHYDR